MIKRGVCVITVYLGLLVDANVGVIGQVGDEKLA